MAILYHQIKPDIYLDYGVTQNPELPDEVSFIAGRIIGEPLSEPLVFEVDFPSDVEIPHFIGDYIPVFSDFLVKILRSGGVDNFQVFPALLQNPETGQEWSGFWAFNAIGLVPAANRELSEGTILMEGDEEGVEIPLIAFNKIVLDKAKTYGFLMFRLAESPKTLIIHHKIEEHIDANRPPNGWNFMATDIETV